MNIHHFENKIEPTILTRGYNYYIEGCILEVSRHEDNEYLFQVEGSELYEVKVKIDASGEIIHSVCDCPYSNGPICKHEAAAYYELLDIINGESECETVQSEAVKHSEIKEVLNALSKAQLIDIIAEITQQNSVLTNSLIFQYSRGNDDKELDKCRKLISSIVKKYTGREGFIGYREAGIFAHEMIAVLEKAGEMDNILLAVDIACLVLEEAVEAFQYADDSDGDIGSLASEAIELIRATIADNPELEPEIREQLFHKLLRQSESSIFDGWEDFRIALLGICADFADVEALRNTLKANIENQIYSSNGQGYQKYTNEALLQILFDMVQKYGEPEEKEQFIIDNLHYSSFREALINQYTQKKNFDKVVELALDGEQQDKDYAGLVLKWQEIRYAAYRGLQRKEEQAKLAEELLLAGKYEYYNELRQLAGGEQDALYDRLKRRLKMEKDWNARSMYLKLIAEANDLDEMMEHVRGNHGAVEEYAGRLAERFTDEVIAIYSYHIKEISRSANKRKSYQEICGMLRRFQKIAGSANQKSMIQELRDLYKNRRAFMDELDKLK